MEDVRRPSYYKSYERKPQTVEEEAPNLYSLISLFVGLGAVFFNVLIECFVLIE